MEGLVSPAFKFDNVVRRKRSNISRRQRSIHPIFLENRTSASSDENAGFMTGTKRKETDLINSAISNSSFNKVELENPIKKSRKDDGARGELNKFYTKRGSSARNEQLRGISDIKRSSEGMLAPANWKRNSKLKDGFESQSRDSSNNRSSGQSAMSTSGLGIRGDSSSNENKLKKVKLKVGGITHTIHAKSSQDNDNPYAKPSRSSEISRRQKDNSGYDHSPPDKMNNLQRFSWKDFHAAERSAHKLKDDFRGRRSDEKQSNCTGPTSEPVRKSRRVPKRRVLDGEFIDADEDDEIRYLERLKTSKAGVDHGNGFGHKGEETKKWKSSKSSKRKLSAGEYDDNEDVEYGSSRNNKDSKKKSRFERESEDEYSIDEDDEEEGLDLVFEAKRKKPKKEFVDSLMDGKKEIPLTMRQKALQSGKDEPAGANASLIEFPNGLPPAPPRKQKQKLSETEQQLKKAEAAQRRKMQNEKAALESQREAIRKILGQDSSRKKREDQLQKRRDELAQERAANAMIIAPCNVRWVLGPTGTTVTFPEDVGLPSIFTQKPSSYPPPRERCVGPSCKNPYKYRDSKSNLPLCSLQCYRAVNDASQQAITS